MPLTPRVYHGEYASLLSGTWELCADCSSLLLSGTWELCADCSSLFTILWENVGNSAQTALLPCVRNGCQLCADCSPFFGRSPLKEGQLCAENSLPLCENCDNSAQTPPQPLGDLGGNLCADTSRLLPDVEHFRQFLTFSPPFGVFPHGGFPRYSPKGGGFPGANYSRV